MLKNVTTETLADPANDRINVTFRAEIDRSAVLDLVASATGDDGLGDPTTSKGLQQVVFADGTFVICSCRQAQEHADINPDFAAMIDVASLRTALRQALN